MVGHQLLVHHPRTYGANSGLAGSGGVDGAVHRAAGPELLAACRDIGGCPTGEARITPGFNLEARYVVHAVGPVWARRSCWRAATGMPSTLPAPGMPPASLSRRSATGVYGYPLGAAAAVAVGTIAAYLEANETKMERVVFWCFGRLVHEVYADALAALPGRAKPVDLTRPRGPRTLSAHNPRETDDG